MKRFSDIKTPKNGVIPTSRGCARVIVNTANKLLVFFMTFIFSLSLASIGNAAESLWKRSTLTGSWGGARDKMSEKGVDFEFIYTGEIMSNVAGGVQKQTDYQHLIDLTMAVDAEKLFKWKGASFFFYGMNTMGGSPSANSGDVQGLSNIESPDFWMLMEAWYQQKLFDDKLSFLLGLYDINSEFDTMEAASLFVNSSHGMGPDFSQAGQNGPSVWPYSSLTLRLRYEPKPWLYWQTAVFDGVPGDPAHPFSTRIKFAAGDGLLIATEVGILTGELSEKLHNGKIALGGWYFTSGFDDLTDVDGTGAPVSRRTNMGIYALGEYRLFKEDEDQGLDAFVRVGWANPSINQINYYAGGGLTYTGLIPKRDEDKIGLGVAAAINGTKFKNAMTAAGTPVESTEVAIEATYRAQVLPWLAVQPDVQYIINPGTDPTVGNALQTGVRFEVNF